MNEETIYDQKEEKNVKQGNNPLNDCQADFDKQQGVAQNEAHQDTKKKNFKTAGFAGAAGVAGAAIGILTPVNVFPDASDDGNEIEGIDNPEDAPSVSSNLQGHDMEVATSVDDSMSFNQAFAAARHEVGPGGLFVWHGHTYGTYYANEWNAMSPEEHDQYWANVYHSTSNLNETAQEDGNGMASNGDGNMEEPQRPTSPEDGDGMASNGDGNIDEPQQSTPPEDGNGMASNGDGNMEEPQRPTPLEDGNGMANNGDGNIDEPQQPTPPEDGNGLANNGEEPLVEPNLEEPGDEPEPLELAEEDVVAEFDLDNDGIADTGFVDANGNEVMDVVLDTTGDGSYDTLVIDPEVDEAGNLVVAEENIVGIGGVRIGEVNVDDDFLIGGDETVGGDLFTDETIDDSVLADNPDVDDFASFEPDPKIAIDNNMDMSDFA